MNTGAPGSEQPLPLQAESWRRQGSQGAGKGAVEPSVPPACAASAGSEHSRKKYRNRQSISHLPLSSGSSCADNKPSKSPYSSETFFSPLLPSSQPCQTVLAVGAAVGLPSSSLCGEVSQSMQPPEHPSRFQRLQALP